MQKVSTLKQSGHSTKGEICVYCRHIREEHFANCKNEGASTLCRNFSTNSGRRNIIIILLLHTSRKYCILQTPGVTKTENIQRPEEFEFFDTKCVSLKDIISVLFFVKQFSTFSIYVKILLRQIFYLTKGRTPQSPDLTFNDFYF